MAVNSRISDSMKQSGGRMSCDISSPLRVVHRAAVTASRPPHEAFAAPAPGAWQVSAFRLGEIEIPRGLVYVGDKLLTRNGAQNDASLMDLRLPVVLVDTDETSGAAKENPAWQNLTPEDRGAYLHWLSGGCQSEQVSTELIWIYIYGLERRLLIDGPRDHFSISERLSIIRELKRIYALYGERAGIADGITRIISVAWAIMHSPEDAMTDQLDFCAPCCSDVFSWYLACIAARREKVSPEIMMTWFQRMPGNRGLVESKWMSGFVTERFKSDFEEGCVLTPSSKAVCIQYHAVKPGLGVLMFEIPRLGDVSEDADVLGKFSAIAADCRNFQVSYEEYRRQPGANQIGALMRLPMRMRMTNPSLRQFVNQMKALVESQPVARIHVRDVFRMLGMKAPAQLTETHVADISSLIEFSAFQFAPNPKLHHTSFDIDDELIVTQSLAIPEVTSAFSILVLLVRLGAIIAQSDEDVSQCEIDVLQNMIMERKVLKESQRMSLLLWLHWCMNTPQCVEDVVQELTGFDDGLRNHISKMLIRVAMADGVLEAREKEVLVKLHRALGFPATWVDLGISGADGGLVIPKVDEKMLERPEDTLSPKRIQREVENSSDGVVVSDDLNQALSNMNSLCDSIPDSMPVLSVFASKKAPLAGGKSSSCLPKLDLPLMRFMDRLTEQEKWDRLKLFKDAACMDLMADRAMASINAASVDVLGEEVITDGDDVCVSTDRLKELYRLLQECR